MPWKEVTKMSERLNACRLAIEGKYSITKIANDFQVSRKTVYKWLEIYKLHGEEHLFDRPKRPKISPNKICESIENRIIELKEEYEYWGARKLHKLLKDELGDVCCKTTVDRVLLRNNLRARIEPKPKIEAVGRFERSKPNELWQIDFTSPFLTSSGIKIYPVPIVDDRTRFNISLLAADGCTCEWALKCFRSGATNYGLPNEILSDHGAAFGVDRVFVNTFTAYMMAINVVHIQGRYAHPQTQGKLERFNRTLKKECILRNNYATIEDWQKCFDEYRYLYNEIRPHESLCDETPSSIYKASEIKFTEPDKSVKDLTEGVLNRKVDSEGKIMLLQYKIKVGRGLTGWYVSAKHDGGGIWTISYKGRYICQVCLLKRARFSP